MPTAPTTLPAVNSVYFHPRGTYYQVMTATKRQVAYERGWDTLVVLS